MDYPIKTILVMLGAVLAVAFAAQVSVPLPASPVPQSLQTLAVVLVGAWLGPLRGGAALILYLAIGAVGAPVFADGAAGAAHLRGPTAGYLVGFVLAAMGMGWWVRQPWSRGFAGVFAGALAAHALVLGAGWIRLAGMLGASVALATGVLPFLVGSVVKSLAAAGVWTVIPKPAGEATATAPEDGPAHSEPDASA